MDKATCQRIHRATVWVFDTETNRKEPQLDKELYARLVQDRNAAQKKLDTHMKDVESRHKELLERYK
jgi:hypothetical protein